MGEGSFNTWGDDTSTPGLSGSGPSKNIHLEVVLRNGIFLAVDQVAKVRGRDLAVALTGFDVLGNG